MWLGEDNFGKFEFLAKFQVMYTQTFKKSTIQSAFKRIGLIPYNFEVVLQQVHILLSLIWAITLSPPNSINKISLVCTTTFYRPYKIKNQAIILINSMKKDQRLVHPKFQPYLD